MVARRLIAAVPALMPALAAHETDAFAAPAIITASSTPSRTSPKYLSNCRALSAAECSASTRFLARRPIACRS
jgi:hypothetical protein